MQALVGFLVLASLLVTTPLSPPGPAEDDAFARARGTDDASHITVIGPRFSPDGADILDPRANSRTHALAYTYDLPSGYTFEDVEAECIRLARELGAESWHRACMWPYIDTVEWKSKAAALGLA